MSDLAPSHTQADLSQQDKSLLRFITCGSVDDGKSSLIGRILYESGSVHEDQLLALEADSKKYGTQGDRLDYALLVDGLSAEREQGITIDVAYRYFSTSHRAFIVADTPGHEQYTRNMATGASHAELAIILVDARKGILPQTRRHSFIVAMMGVKNIIVAVNKMDLVDYSQSIFAQIETAYRDIASQLNIPHVVVIPVSAVNGDNIITLSSQTSWYKGPSLIQHLNEVNIESASQNHSFAMPVQWVNRPDSQFRGFSGQIASGHIRTGDHITILPSQRLARIARIVTFDDDLDEAEAGQSVTLVLDREVDVSRGDVIATGQPSAHIARAIYGQFLWMSAEPFQHEKSYLAKIGATTIQISLQAPSTLLDIESYTEQKVYQIGLNSIFKAHMTFDRCIAVERYDDMRDLGSFILIDRISNEVVALGVVLDLTRPILPQGQISSLRRYRPVYEPRRRTLLKTISFAVMVIVFGVLVMVCARTFLLNQLDSFIIFFIGSVLVFACHERLWAHSNRGMQSDVHHLSAGDGI